MRIALALALPLLVFAQSALLEIKVIEGAGAVYAPESRTPGLAVEVTDELGKPVPEAVVSVRLPDDGAGGSFANGLSSEIVTTSPQGRAITSPIRWNRVTGTVEIRLTAVKGRLRAGTLTTCEISDSAPARGGAPHAQPLPVSRKRFPLKWVALGAVAVAAVAGVGLAKGRSGGASDGGSGTDPGSSTGGVQIGTPVIIIGKP
jgi:hypothetical protein